MKVVEAGLDDKSRWDAFVDSEGGAFHLYFDWKYFYEARGYDFIPLMAVDDSSRIAAILPVVRRKRFLYSFLESLPENSGGFLFRKGISEAEKAEAITSLVERIDRDYSKGCAALNIQRTIVYTGEDSDFENARDEECDGTIVASGLEYSYNRATGFPCTHLLRLEQPFEEKIWMGLWTKKLRSQINKAARTGVTVVEDRDFQYLDVFTEMLIENYRRHRNTQDVRSDIRLRYELFKDKTKLFLIFMDQQPVVGLLCHYTPTTCCLARVGSYAKDTGHISKLSVKVVLEDASNAGYKLADLGISGAPGVAEFKSRFQFERIPFGMYHKEYPGIRTRLYQVSLLKDALCSDKMYLWHNRRKLWNRLLNIKE